MVPGLSLGLNGGNSCTPLLPWPVRHLSKGVGGVVILFAKAPKLIVLVDFLSKSICIIFHVNAPSVRNYYLTIYFPLQHFSYQWTILQGYGTPDLE